MKLLVYILILGGIFLSCKKDEIVFQGDWIEKYHYFDENEPIFYFPKRIFSFKKDSIIIQNFHFENNYNNERIKRGTFQIEKEKLIFQFENAIDTFDFKFNASGNLHLKSKESNMQFVFEKIEEFKNKNQFEILKKDLTESVFKFSHDTIKYDLTEDKKYTISGIDRDMPSSLFWEIEIFKDEVFLVFAGSLEPALQLKSIKNDTLFFKVYYQENIDLKFHKVPPNQIYESDQLIGNWIKVNYSDFDIEEFIEFTDSTVTKTIGSREENQSWKISKIGNVIVFKHPWKMERKNHWNIKSISKDELIIIRNIRANEAKKRVQEISFIKKK